MKSLIKKWIPPILASYVQGLKKNHNIFEGNFSSWDEAAAVSTGYDEGAILSLVLDSTLKVISGEAAYERDSVLFDEVQYSWPVTAALMRNAALNNGDLRVLDFGGALGSTYFQNRKFLNGLRKVEWNVIEQPHFVEIGRRHIQCEQLRFYRSIDECLLVATPDLVLLSSVAQYLPDLNALLQRVNEINASMLVFDRTPFFNEKQDMICVQRVPAVVYPASYPMRLISRSNLEAKLDRWRLIEKFSCPEGISKTKSNKCFEFSGMVLERKYAG